MRLPPSAIQTHLIALYGEAAGRAAFERLRARLTPLPGPFGATPPPSPNGRGGRGWG
jgi:hypothetical protein